MKTVKSIFALIALSVVVTSCTDLELEEQQNPIENPQSTGDGDDDNVGEKEKDD